MDKCNAYHAEYKSREVPANDYVYALRIKENSVRNASVAIRAYFSFFVKNKDGLILSDTEVPYQCVGMSVTRCYLKFSKTREYDLAGLKKDLSVNVAFSQNPAPYVIVIPSITGAFDNISGSSDVKIKYFTGEKILPDLSVPIVWQFDRCISDRE